MPVCNGHQQAYRRSCGNVAAAEANDVIGTLGTVTGRVGTGTVGEVVLPLPSGGTQGYFAHLDPGLPAGVRVGKGTQVVVTRYRGPRTVWVCPLQPTDEELAARGVRQAAGD